MNNSVAEFPIVANNGASPGGPSGLPARRREAAAMPANGPSQRLRIVSTRDADGAATPTSSSTTESCEALLLANLHVIDGVVRFVCQRHRLNPTEAEDFSSEVRLRLVDNDYNVLASPLVLEHRIKLIKGMIAEAMQTAARGNKDPIYSAWGEYNV